MKNECCKKVREMGKAAKTVCDRNRRKMGELCDSVSDSLRKNPYLKNRLSWQTEISNPDQQDSPIKKEKKIEFGCSLRTAAVVGTVAGVLLLSSLLFDD